MTKVHTVHPSIYTFKAGYFWANVNFAVYSHVLKCRPPQAGMKEFNHKHKWKSPFLLVQWWWASFELNRDFEEVEDMSNVLTPQLSEPIVEKHHDARR